MWRFFLFIFLSIQAFANNLIPTEIAALIQKHNVQQDDLSLYIQEIDIDGALVSLNADTPRHPASVTKLLTTGAALKVLGADFRWQTRFFLDNPPDANGVAQGNLYIQGGGDPFLVEERFFDALQQLRAKGLRHFTGNVVIDDGIFRLAPHENNSFTFDGEGLAEYNAIPYPLMINFRLLDITTNGKQVVLRPNITTWKVVNHIQMVKSKKCANNFIHPELVRHANGHAILTLTGKYSTACGMQKHRVVLGEGSELFYYWFRDVWTSLGGSFDGKGILTPLKGGVRLFYSAHSVPLTDAIASMNKHSNNVMTRQLMLSLPKQKPTSLGIARGALLQGLADLGVNTNGIVVDNGSGLSRETRVTARQLTQLLQALAHNPHFIQSLAVSGESGTMKKRFRGEPLHGAVQAKTGTIKNVRSLAGYLTSQSGRHYSFVIMANGKTAAISRGLQDDVLRWLYTK